MTVIKHPRMILMTIKIPLDHSHFTVDTKKFDVINVSPIKDTSFDDNFRFQISIVCFTRRLIMAIR